MDEKIVKLQELIDQHDNIVFFGGAGVSTESGIPDFRSQDGLYHQKYDFPPETILSHTFFLNHPEEFYKFYRDKMLCDTAKPNAAHLKLAELEEAAKPFHLRIEGPMDAGEREKQMLCMKGLREELDRRGINVELVADEWCKTLSTSATTKQVTWLRSKLLTWVVSTTPSKQFCTAKSMASVHTRAVPATRPTVPARYA